MNRKKDWNSGKDKPGNQGTQGISRPEIKLDYHTISTRFLEMQESNSRLQKLITKFTTDPDRQLRSVFESVQYQNSIAREARKTSVHFKPRANPSRTVPTYGPSNGLKESHLRLPLMSRHLNPVNGTINRNKNDEDHRLKSAFEVEILETTPQPSNRIYLNLDKEVKPVRSRQMQYEENSGPGPDREPDEVPSSFFQNFGLRLQR